MKYAHIFKEYHVEYLGIFTEKTKMSVEIQILFYIKGQSSLAKRRFTRATYDKYVELLYTIPDKGSYEEAYPELFL